jgi:hypothetical protein
VAIKNGAGAAAADSVSEAREGASSQPNSKRTELLTKINAAVAAANKAEQTVTTAQGELRSRSMAVGLLLLEAKKLNSAVKDFDAFLKRVDGLKLSRAYDLLRLAGGRVTDEELKEDARQRKQKSRDRKKKQPLPEPKKREPVSVTNPDVTETVKADPEKRKPEKHETETGDATTSARALAEFTFACRAWLPKITVKADRQKAALVFSDAFYSKPGTADAEAA